MSKKLFLVLLVAVLTANYVQAQLTFGVRAGANLTNVYRENSSGKMEGLDWKPGFQVGVVADYPLLDDLYFQPGILFSQQGMKAEMSVSGYKAKVTWDLNYIQVPLNFQYSNETGHLYIQAGPYLGYGISGNMKAAVSSGGTSVSNSEKIIFGSGSDADFKSFDVGLGVGAGLHLGNLQAGLGINYGLVNINPDSKMNNLGLVLTVTYLFSKKNK